MFQSSRLGIWLGVVVLAGCGGTAEVPQDPPPAPTGGTGASGGTGGKGNPGGNAGTGGSGVPIGGKGGSSSGGSAGSGGSGSDPCRNFECDDGQRCEVNGEGEAECVDNTCDDIACGDDELCIAAPGGGHVCIDKCHSDAACEEAQFCDTASGECVDDTCVPDTQTCGADDSVRVCDSNGSPREPIACESGGYYESECSANDVDVGACTCEDDWDCPEFMVCEAGRCAGTGVEPTCTLPATPFSEVLPVLEFRWGGERHEYPNDDDDDVNDDAVGKAFPWSAQVVSVPLVVNLDDDNGDGKADERDFPEILFISHHDTQRDEDGIVRAVHGGGADKGEDYFALCGNPARPATPAGTYSDTNGAYWSDRLDPAVACDDANPCATGTNCRNARCVPDALVNCSSSASESRTTGLARSSSALAAGDLDDDGFPEIVVALETKAFQILNNRGEVLFLSPDFVFEPELDAEGDELFYVAPAPAIANLDFAGMPEIIIGNRVISLLKDANGAFGIDKIYVGSAARGTQDQVDRGQNVEDFVTGPTVCVADITADTGLEIVAGLSAYRLPASADGCGTVAAPCALELVWDARAAVTPPDGFCAIADVLPACTSTADCAAKPPGPANPLDGKPEVVLIADGRLVILDAETGTLLLDSGLGGGVAGGAPNIDDFDGDGFPEIATALSDFYQVIDLQAPDATNCPAWDSALDDRGAPPQDNPERTPGGASCNDDADCDLPGTTCNELAGRCVCLHNGWKRDTEDDSSRVTSSSVFDFNGDGAAEVVYGDECYFRVYDGASGGVYLALPSVSRTIIENPVVADVDNDGNAEIVFIANNWVEQCNEADADRNGWDPGEQLSDWPDGMVDIDSLPSGITVLGDPTDTWVAARRVWNQHAYHVTNVLESGAIPQHEPENWKPLNGRLYNTYRSQPRNYGVAPDLALTAIQISSPDAMCGELSDQIQITVVVKNQGDLRVGPGVEVEFYGTWDGDEERLADMAGDPIVVVLDKSLEPGGSTLVTVTYDVGNNDAPNDEALPDSVRVTIDGGNDSGDSVERECNEDNNEIDGAVDAGDDLPDLAATVDAANCGGDVTVTVTNTGSEEATDIVVRVYAGDPSAGGEVLGDETIEGPLGPGEDETITIDVGSQGRNLTVWVVADPDDAITECNDANNVDEGPSLICDDEPH
jgi:hypothetical protein